jgi:hypothetical protein
VKPVKSFRKYIMKSYFLHKIERIEMLLSDLLAVNTSLAGQLSKVETEIVAKLAELQQAITDLQTQLADAPLTEAQAASVQAVVDGVNALDNIVPDA